MICKASYFWNSKSKNCFCSEPSKIENYDLAIADTTQTWECHHRLETHTSDGERRLVDLTANELKALGVYYNRPPEEFIFLTKEVHVSLHFKDRKQKSETIKKRSFTRKQNGNYTPSKETREKISNSLKGHIPSNKGKSMSNDQKLKISNTLKGKKQSEETRRKRSESRSKLGWKIDPVTGTRVYYKKEV